jgi:hypothetical protein
MPKTTKGKVVMQITVTPETEAALKELAGGERMVGKYLNEMVPILIAAQSRLNAAERRAKQIAVMQIMAEQEEGDA